MENSTQSMLDDNMSAVTGQQCWYVNQAEAVHKMAPLKNFQLTQYANFS